MNAKRRNRRLKREGPGLRQLVASTAALLQSGVLLLSIAALVAVIFLGLEALRALPVERIVVAGKLENLRHNAVRETLAAELDGGLLFLDLEGLQQRLEAMPWVYRAELRRRFPDTLEVRVYEQVPIARWGDTAFLNHEAIVIEVEDRARWADLPQIRGPKGSAPRLMTHYRRLRLDLAGLDLTPVALVEDNFGQLAVTLDNGVEIQLGDRDFRLRLQRFLRLWQDELAAGEAAVTRVDLRYESGAAVAFEDVAQVAVLAESSVNR
jgi:cell division protein FtsQ